MSEFSAQLAAAKKEKNLQFQTQWNAFLNRQTNEVPLEIEPAQAREATENFLLKSGGLKARFAIASRDSQFGFTLKRPADEQDRKGGFHRTQKSIFMDISTTTSNEWLLIFVHEVAHSLDSELLDSLKIYNNETYVKQLAEFGLKNRNLSDLSRIEQEQLKNWLIAGLNRGFLAEYRAWLLTYLIYEEGLADGTFTEMAWLEKLKSTRPPSVAIADHILRFLSPSWKDPVDGIFKYEFIQQALTELRKEIDAHPETIKMGAIGNLIQ